MELIHGYIQLDIAAADPRACETADQDDLPNDLERALNAVENIRTQIKRGRGSKRAKRGSVPAGKLPPRAPSATEDETLLTVTEAAKILGIAVRTLRNRICKAQFTSEHGLIENGKRCPRVRKTALMRCIRDGTLFLPPDSVSVA
jgi:hypothetical protein